MGSYAAKVKRDIARWQEAGLVDAQTAEKLSFDIERNSGRKVFFGTVLTMMAAVLFVAALLIFVAANWDEIPRLLRVAMLFALIFSGYVGGAVLKLMGREAAGEAGWLIAGAGFGASIALIAQIYHLSGDEAQAIFIWGAGVALAAAALRSGPLTVGAVLLAGAWMTMQTSSGWYIIGPPLTWLAIACVLYLLSFWTQSLLSRHLLLLSLYLYVLFFHVVNEHSLFAPLALLAAVIGVFICARLRPALTEYVAGLSGAAISVQALAGFLAAVGMMQMTLHDEPGFVFATIVALAGIVVALLVAGRDNRTLRWFAYVAFAFQLCFLYLVMLGTMMDTAGFFLLAGLTLSVLAFLISRLERRLADPIQAVSGMGGQGDRS